MGKYDFNFGFNNPADPQWDDDVNNKNPWGVDWLRGSTVEEEKASQALQLTVEYVRKQIQLITETVRKANRTMLKSPTDQPSKRGGPRNGIPFLKVENLTQEPKRAKILAVKEDTDGKFNDYVLKLVIAGTSYFWGLRVNNPNFAFLYAAYGADENQWVGKEFLIFLEYDEFSEKLFPRVKEAPTSDVTKSAKAKP